MPDGLAFESPEKARDYISRHDARVKELNRSSTVRLMTIWGSHVLVREILLPRTFRRDDVLAEILKIEFPDIQEALDYYARATGTGLATDPLEGQEAIGCPRCNAPIAAQWSAPEGSGHTRVLQNIHCADGCGWSSEQQADASSCCLAPITVAGDTTQYYVCWACKKACDSVRLN